MKTFFTGEGVHTTILANNTVNLLGTTSTHFLTFPAGFSLHQRGFAEHWPKAYRNFPNSTINPLSCVLVDPVLLRLCNNHSLPSFLTQVRGYFRFRSQRKQLACSNHQSQKRYSSLTWMSPVRQLLGNFIVLNIKYSKMEIGIVRNWNRNEFERYGHYKTIIVVTFQSRKNAQPDGVFN